MSKQRKGAGRLDGQAATEITHIAKKTRRNIGLLYAMTPEPQEIYIRLCQHK